MTLFVQTYLDKSPISGIGLFAGEDIHAGSPIWAFNPALDITLNNAEFAALDVQDQEWIRIYACYEKSKSGEGGIWVLATDNSRFMNHSNEPTNRAVSTRESVAARDIAKGEEITCDYRGYGHKWDDGPDFNP